MSATIEVQAAPAASKKAATTKRWRRLGMFSLLALAIAGAGIGYRTYWVEVGSRHVTTDNAYTAAEVAVVTSQVDGRVTDVRAVDSQTVHKGDVLVVIDPTDARLALSQAQADLER